MNAYKAITAVAMIFASLGGSPASQRRTISPPPRFIIPDGSRRLWTNFSEAFQSGCGGTTDRYRGLSKGICRNISRVLRRVTNQTNKVRD